VILVPGYGGDRAMLGDLAAKLRAAGRTVSVLALPDDATGDFHDQERVLATAVTAALRVGAASVDLVGYSAGGIVVALYVAADPSHVRRVVTLASPLHGTKLAALAASVAASACPAACQQMVPGNPVLASLAAAEPGTSGVPWRTIRSAHDSVVTPIESAEFSGAQNLELQAICADDDAGHTTIPQDPLAEGLTVQALNDPLPMPAPTPADCAKLRTTA
jgi:triacylglycerol lipase